MFSKKKKSERNHKRSGASNANRASVRSEPLADMPRNGRTQIPLKAGNNAPSIISPDLTVKGSLVSLGDVHVEGSVDGDVQASSLTIGEHATIHGEVCADDLTIKGRVEGSVRANKVKLAESAYIQGDIVHQSLAVEAGAHFEGQVKHSQDPLSETFSKKLESSTSEKDAELSKVESNLFSATEAKERQSEKVKQDAPKPAASPTMQEQEASKKQSDAARVNPFTLPKTPNSD